MPLFFSLLCKCAPHLLIAHAREVQIDHSWLPFLLLYFLFAVEELLLAVADEDLVEGLKVLLLLSELVEIVLGWITLTL